MSELKITISAMSTTAYQIRSVCNEESDEKSRSEPINEDMSQSLRVLGTAIDSPDDNSSTKPVSNRVQLLRQRKLLGPVEYNKTVRSRHQRNILTTQPDAEGEIDEMFVTIRLPTWLLPRRYQFRARRAYSGWEYSLRSSSIVPSSSLVFEFSKDGNIEGLKDLFNTRKASPFDTDVCGFTPLHVSFLLFIAAGD
jgi:hypothetical protein